MIKIEDACKNSVLTTFRLKKEEKAEGLKKLHNETLNTDYVSASLREIK
jgi:hypothetical protein